MVEYKKLTDPAAGFELTSQQHLLGDDSDYDATADKDSNGKDNRNFL